MGNTLKIFVLLAFLLPLLPDVQAQPQFFEYIRIPEPEGRPRLIADPNGGWFVAYVTKLPFGSQRNYVQFNRFDPCGEIIDDFGYEFPSSGEFYLRDALIVEDGSFWLAFQSVSELNKWQGMIVHFDQAGNILDNKVIRSPDSFYLYAIGENEQGSLVAFGNTTDSGNRSVIVEMNSAGELIQAKYLMDTPIWGTFLPTSDGGYICRSGPEYYKVSESFTVSWVIRIPDYYATGKPVEAADGYVFSIYPYAAGNSDQNMLIKLDRGGNLVWKSRNFGSGEETLIKLLGNGNIMQIGNGFPEPDVPSHIVFTEVGQDGSMVRQKAFNADFTRGMAGSDFIELNSGAFVFAGSALNQKEVIHAMTTPRFSLLCGDYFYAQSTPSADLEIFGGSANAGDEEISVLDSEAVFEIETSLTDRFCFENVITPPDIPNDTSLCPGDSLLADFRNTDYEVEWFDGSRSKYRFLKAPGSYEVTFTSCNETLTEAIDIDQEDCTCNFFVPNIITPNGDQVNDQFRLFVNCAVREFRMQVFDRWGNVVFESADPGEGWPQPARFMDYPEGIYVAMLQFRAFGGNIEEQFTISQDITLIR